MIKATKEKFVRATPMRPQQKLLLIRAQLDRADDDRLRAAVRRDPAYRLRADPVCRGLLRDELVADSVQRGPTHRKVLRISCLAERNRHWSRKLLVLVILQSWPPVWTTFATVEVGLPAREMP